MNVKDENLPTNRIGAIIADYDELSNEYDVLAELALKFCQPDKLNEFVSLMPRKPIAEAVIDEKHRRRYSIKRAGDTRRRMRRLRMLGDRARQRGHQEFSDDAEIIAEIDRLVAEGKPLRGEGQ